MTSKLSFNNSSYNIEGKASGFFGGKMVKNIAQCFEAFGKFAAGAATEGVRFGMEAVKAPVKVLKSLATKAFALTSHEAAAIEADSKKAPAKKPILRRTGPPAFNGI